MARRKKTTTNEETATQPPANAQPASEPALPPVPQETVTAMPLSPATQETAAAPAEAQAQPPALAHAPIPAPPKGEGRSWTIDNRLGYRKEESADGRRRQIRFADRDGGRPDDETLAPVRDKKPAVSWAPKEKAWQARKDQEGLEAIDLADQQLAELGRKRTGGQER